MPDSSMRGKRRAVVIINAYTTLESELHQPYAIAKALRTRGVETDVLRNGCFPAYLGRESIAATWAEQYDFAVYLDKDKYLSKLLERAGMRLFNSSDAVEACDDKLLTAIALSGIAPMPKTLPAPLCYTPSAAVNEEMLNRAEELLGYPMVVKECFGSLGKGVHLARDRAELRTLSARLKGVPHLFQEFIQESKGRDLRVILIGGKVVSAMERRSEHDFRSNAELGGKGTPYTPDSETVALCERVAEALRLDYCGVDLLFGKEGMLLSEVNSNAFFGTIERVTGVDVAARYAEYLVKAVYGE